MFIVVAYDIVSDKRRNEVANVLKDYGTRINFSVFECEINKESLSELKSKIAGIISRKKDSIVFYEICKSCNDKKEYMGVKKSEDIELVINL